MNEIIRTCKKHGDLTQNDLIKKGIERGKQRYGCRKCQKELHHKNYDKNREKILDRNRLYRELNQEKIKVIKHNYNILNIDLIRKRRHENRKKYDATYRKLYKENNRLKVMHAEKIRMERYRKNITNSYLKNGIQWMKKGLIKFDDLPSEVIEIKRQCLFIKRKIKEIKRGDVKNGKDK